MQHHSNSALAVMQNEHSRTQKSSGDLQKLARIPPLSLLPIQIHK